MNKDTSIAEAELRSLGDYLERILLSSYPFLRPAAGFTLFACYGLASVLAERTDTIRTRRLGSDLVERLVAACREELAPLERAIDQTTGWAGKRLVPSGISEDEMTLRWLVDVIARYLDGLEPEYVGLPVHQLNRTIRHARLMQVWDVADDKYQPNLRAAIRQLERAITAAMCAPRN